jgi:hypothetical protein
MRKSFVEQKDREHAAKPDTITDGLVDAYMGLPCNGGVFANNWANEAVRACSLVILMDTIVYI